MKCLKCLKLEYLLLIRYIDYILQLLASKPFHWFESFFQLLSCLVIIDVAEFFILYSQRQSSTVISHQQSQPSHIQMYIAMSTYMSPYSHTQREGLSMYSAKYKKNVQAPQSIMQDFLLAKQFYILYMKSLVICIE